MPLIRKKQFQQASHRPEFKITTDVQWLHSLGELINKWLLHLVILNWNKRKYFNIAEKG